MVKHTKNKQIALSNHFSMEPKGICFFKEKVQVDYGVDSEELKKLRFIQFLKADRNLKSSIIPTYNNDKLFYTPSFYLPGQKIDSKMHEFRYKCRLDSIQEIDQSKILPPKPTEKVYCYVCQYIFQDYQKHIKSQIHLQKQKRNKYHNKIVKLCKKIEKINLSQKQLKIPSDFFQDSNSISIVINKKRKTKVLIDLTQDSD